MRCSSRRYGIYWTTVGELSDEAERLVQGKEAVTIPVDGADEFFERLYGRILALDEYARSGAIGTELVTSEAKRFLADPTHRIRLHDLVADVGERSLAAIDFDGNVSDDSVEAYLRKAAGIEEASNDLIAVHSVLGAFSNVEDQYTTIRRTIERLATPTHKLVGGRTAWINLRGYPTLLAMYGSGISSVATDSWSAIGALLSAKSMNPGRSGAERHPVVSILGPYRVLDVGALNSSFDGSSRRKTPISDYLHDRLAPRVKPVLRLGDDQYADAFDEWEYLLGVVGYRSTGGALYIGRWVWRRKWDFDDGFTPRRAFEGMLAGLVRIGLFSDGEDLEETVKKFDTEVRRLGLHF